MDSMEEIYRKHARMIYCFLLTRTNEPELAEELTQETFYQAVKSVHRFEGKSSVSTWLCGIAKNVWYTWQKKHRSEELSGELENELGQQHSAEQEAMVNWDRVEILKMLHHLKEPVREVMYLRLIANLSFREIGEIMERTENWARVNYYRGKEKILKGVRDNE